MYVAIAIGNNRQKILKMQSLNFLQFRIISQWVSSRQQADKRGPEEMLDSVNQERKRCDSFHFQ
jgi:hypothetical protein